MALWTYESDFEAAQGYSVGALVGQDSWTNSSGSGTISVQNTVTYAGSQAVIAQAGGQNKSVYRNVTDANTDGTTLYFSGRTTSILSSDNSGIGMYGNNGATLIGLFYLNQNLGFAVWRNGTNNNISAILPNTWYRWGVEFDFTNDRCRFSVDNGAFGSYYNFASTVNEIDRIYIDQNNGDGSDPAYYWDTISASYTPAGGGVVTGLFNPLLGAG